MSDDFVPVFAKTTDGKPLTKEQTEALLDDLRGQDAQTEEKLRATKGGDRAGQAESAAPPSHARPVTEEPQLSAEPPPPRECCECRAQIRMKDGRWYCDDHFPDAGKMVDERSPVSAAERAVLEAVPRLRNSLLDLMHESTGVAGLHLNGDLATWEELCRGGRFEQWLIAFDEFEDAVDALRAARRPEKPEKPPMVCFETDLKTPTLARQWAIGWHGRGLQTVVGSVLLRRVLRVLPASEVEGGYSPAEQALADEITKAMEARRAHAAD